MTKHHPSSKKNSTTTTLEPPAPNPISSEDEQIIKEVQHILQVYRPEIRESMHEGVKQRLLKRKRIEEIWRLQQQ